MAPNTMSPNTMSPNTMAPFTLAHLSDPHLAPLPKPRLIELAGKRAFGYVNWTRNRHKYQRREVLDALVTDMKAQAPDHIAVTGDLVTTIPGNHDAYVRATFHRFGETFAPYLSGDDGRIGFPSVRRRGPLALISLSTAVPTLPLMATGTLGRDQLAALEALLDRLAAEDVFRVLLVHHPLKSDARQKRMTDAAALLALLKRHGVELILHGHDHIHSTMWFEGPNGNIPALGVPSASALAHGRYPAAAYNLLRIEKDNAGWRCEQTVRGLGTGFQVGQIKHVRLI